MKTTGELILDMHVKTNNMYQLLYTSCFYTGCIEQVNICWFRTGLNLETEKMDFEKSGLKSSCSCHFLVYETNKLKCEYEKAHKKSLQIERLNKVETFWS